MIKITKSRVIGVTALSLFLFCPMSINLDAAEVATRSRELSMAKYTYMMNHKMEAEANYASQSSEDEHTISDEDQKYIDELLAKLGEKADGTERDVESETLDVPTVAVSRTDNWTITRAITCDEPQSETVQEKDALITGVRIDEDYKGRVVNITGQNRKYLEELVMSEAGGEGFIGCALVAQCIRDNMMEEGTTNVLTIKKIRKYSGELGRTPNENVKKAVAFIFDEGGMAIQHHLYCYYAPGTVSSKWHESQQFVVKWGGHRFFDRW